MVELTPLAASKLLDIMTEKQLVGYGLRVFVSGGGCGGVEYGMGFDTQSREGDTVETQHGLQVFVDPMSAPYLDGATIDFSDEVGGFRIENPRMVDGCSSCGSGRGSCCG